MKTPLPRAAVPAPKTYRVYFGTSVEQERGGIYMALFDMQTGRLGKAVHAGHAQRAGFIAIHPDERHIYSTGANTEYDGVKTGAVNAFRITEPDGTLVKINTQPSGGLGACHVSIDPTGKNVLVANYFGGSCAVLPIESDGSLAPASFTQKHTGSSIHPERQTAAFTHSINCDPSGRFAIVADLGMDKILIYRFDASAGTLTPNNPPFVAIGSGGGPRHFTFHPSGKFAYADLELSNEAIAFQYDADKGALKEIQTISTLPDGFTGESTTSEILTTPDGRFLYVGNRGHDSLAIFSIDPANGKLTAIGHESTRGKVPRNFNIDPTGTYLLAANLESNNVVVFRIDRETGQLEFTGSEIKVPEPICIRFLAAP